MMSNKQIASAYNGFASRLGDRAAYELFMDKFPDYEDELNQLIQGKLDLSIELPADSLINVETLMEAPDDEDDLDVTNLRAAIDGDVIDDEYIPVPVRAPRVKADKPAEPAPVVSKPAASGQTKVERAIAIYRASADKSRKALIEQFISQLGMTSAGAATYVQNIKKKLGV